MFGEAKLSNSELTWYGIILWAVVFTACEATFSFSYATRLQNWQLWSDGIIASIFIVDLVYDLRKRSKQKKAQLIGESTTLFWLGMLVNILACIPYDILFYVFQVESAASYLSLIRLIRLVRIAKVFQILGGLTIIPKALRVKIYIILSIVAVHLMACGWVLIYPPKNGIDITTHYIQSVYWAITTLTTIGYGDITPTTNIGRIYTMAIMIMGVGVYGIVIANVSQIFAESARLKEQQREKLHELSLFMRYYNIPGRLQEAAFNYYKHLMTKRLSDNDQKIIGDLPQALQGELKTYMNMKLIGGLPVFKDCTTACLKDVASLLSQLFYAPGKSIIQIGEKGHEMYIIGHGVVEIILDDGSIVASLHEGQFFGEQALLEETTRNASVRAQTYCDLYKLEKDDFIKIIERHPELLENMQKMSNRRSSDKA